MRRCIDLLRRFIHRRYVRAVLISVALPAAALSILASTMEVRHQVSHRAVLRFFSRQHLDTADLHRWIRDPRTTRGLERLFEAHSAVNSGGLVYAHADALEFHLHATRRSLAAQGDLEENRIIFPRLAAAYYASDPERFLEELKRQEVVARLEREGVYRLHQRRLQEKLEQAFRRPQRFAALRLAGRVMEHFVPYRGERYELDLPEALRFYERSDPEGFLVGIFEVRGLQAFAGDEDPWAATRGERSHYVTLSRSPDGCIQLVDHFRGSSTQYQVCPVDHPMGQTLYRVERLPPSSRDTSIAG